jgi:hypothetical protein
MVTTGAELIPRKLDLRCPLCPVERPQYGKPRPHRSARTLGINNFQPLIDECLHRLTGDKRGQSR